MNKRNDRLLMIAIALIMMIGTTASADNWKNMDFRKQSSTTGWSRKGSSNRWNTGSWNYSGTQLNGVTHGGGSNPYNRNYDRNENRGWDFGQANGRYDVTRQSAGVRGNVSGSYSFNTASPAAGKRVHLVTSKTFAEGSGRHYGGYAGGGSTEKTYRYAPQKAHYGENMATTANMMAVKQSSSSSLSSSSSSSSDNVQMDENGKSGQRRIGRKNGTGGPSGQAGSGGPVDEAPLGDGLLTLLLMAVAMTVWKIKTHN